MGRFPQPTREYLQYDGKPEAALGMFWRGASGTGGQTGLLNDARVSLGDCFRIRIAEVEILKGDRRS
jgi:hypothetical protein